MRKLQNISFYMVIILVILSCDKPQMSKNDKIDTSKNNRIEIKPKNETFAKESEQVINDTNNKVKYQYYHCNNADCASIVYHLDKDYLSTPTEKNILYYYKRLFPVFIFSQDDWKQDTNNEIKMHPKFYQDRLIYQNLPQGYLEFYDYREIKGKEHQKFAHKNQMCIFSTNQGQNFIFVNASYLQVVLLDYEKNMWNNSFTYTHPQYGAERIFYSTDVFLGIDIKNMHFKLPEYGTTILACRDKRDFIEYPDAFWADKIKNYPQDIIYLDWQANKGKFSVRK